MVTRVAQAIEDAIKPDRTLTWSEKCERAARVAIEAMREPTQAMITAARGGLPYDRPAEDSWRDMINEALK